VPPPGKNPSDTHCVYCCLRRKRVQWHGMHIGLFDSKDSRRLHRNFPWEHATTSSHELQNFEQRILYRVVTHARYIKKWVVGADFPLKRHTNFISFLTYKKYIRCFSYLSSCFAISSTMNTTQENFTAWKSCRGLILHLVMVFNLELWPSEGREPFLGGFANRYFMYTTALLHFLYF